MVTFLQALVLGLIQGITEWLPVSSSGHLVILQNFFGIRPPVIFDIMLHIGSLIVILLVFYKDIKELIIGLIKKDKKSAKYILKLAAASVPIALVGYFLNDLIKSVFNSLITVGISLLITSAFLFMSKYPENKTKGLTVRNTFLIGLAQALAILPGISRSGATISTGLMQGIKHEKTTAFAFLMFIPAIIGAVLLEIKNIGKIENLLTLSSSLIAVIISGYLSLKVLLYIINKNKLNYFAWYCLFLGLFILAYVIK